MHPTGDARMDDTARQVEAEAGGGHSGHETRQQTWSITAIALDGRLDLNALRADSEWTHRRSYPYGRSYDIGGGRTLFFLGFGAVVCQGVERIDSPLRDRIEAAVSRHLLPDTEETHFITVDPNRASDAPRVGWDRVVIPELRPELLGAVALLLAQSAALERYELAADALLDEVLALSRDQVRRGRLPRGTKKLIERVGRLTRDRLELARWFFLVDRPEETWEDPQVAHLYDALFTNLELRQRHDAMLHKLGAAERATQATIDMWHGKRSNALEWAIVVLIVVEIVLALLRM